MSKAASKPTSSAIIVDAEDMSGYWPRDPEGLEPAPEQTDAWKLFRKTLAKKPFDFDASVPGLRIALEKRPKEPIALDVDSAAALLHAPKSAWRYRDAGIEYLCTRMSPADVLAALLLATTYKRSGWSTLAVTIEESTAITTSTFPYWKAFLRAPEEEQSAARSLAAESWAGASVHTRGALLSCFPDRADWALELSNTPDDCEFVLLGSLTDLEALRKLTFYGPQLVNVVENLPLDQAAEYFDEGFQNAADESGEKPTANALARMCTPAAAAVFVKHMRKKIIRARAVAYFTTHPELAPGALGDLAKKKTKLAATAREILERAERSGAPARVGASDTETGDKDVSTKPAPEAKPSEVPAVLRDPPWPKKRKASKTKPLENLTIPTEPCRMHWPLLSRQRHLIDRLSWAQNEKIVGQPLARIKEAAADVDFEGHWNLDGILAIHGDDAAHAVASVIAQKRAMFWIVGS